MSELRKANTVFSPAGHGGQKPSREVQDLRERSDRKYLTEPEPLEPEPSSQA